MNTLADLGKIEAINLLYTETTFKPTNSLFFDTEGRAFCVNANRLFIEGIDFDLTYFPLEHLGYKTVVAISGELYASLSHPRTLSVILGVSAKLDFPQIKTIWKGITRAAKEHGYSSINLDLVPSPNGLTISISGAGERSLLTEKRRMPAKSMDLICVSNNLGGAYLGLQILERERKKFEGKKETEFKPDLESYKHLVGAYLKPEIEAKTLGLLEEEEIIPSYGYLITKGLADAVKKLCRDSELGAKIYVDRLPFANKTFDLSKELDIDAISVAMNGGEDYRLLFTIPINKHDKFRHDFQTFDIIGHLAQPEVGPVIVSPDGVEFPIKAQGWEK